MAAKPILLLAIQGEYHPPPWQNQSDGQRCRATRFSPFSILVRIPMATGFRAAVMLATLVGLPAAWLYYGPLPPAAQRVVDQATCSIREAIGLPPSDPRGPTSSALSHRDAAPAPAFVSATARASAVEGIATAAAHPRALPRSPAASPAANPSGFHPLGEEGVPRVSRAPASSPGEGGQLDAQTEGLFEQLRQLGAADYQLRQWGTSGDLYRFECSMPLAANPEHTRHFEAVAGSPRASVERVMSEVSSWQLARRSGQVYR